MGAVPGWWPHPFDTPEPVIARDRSTGEIFPRVRRTLLKHSFAGVISAVRGTSARANTRVGEGDRDEQAAAS